MTSTHDEAAEKCRTYEVDGSPVMVRGSEPLSTEGEAALAELVRAVHAMHTTEEWDAIGRKQAAALERIHARNQRLLGGDSR